MICDRCDHFALAQDQRINVSQLLDCHEVHPILLVRQKT